MRATSKTWPRDALPRGTALHGFAVEEILGRGGFGITYLVRDKIDLVFAVKECFPKQFAVREGLEVLPTDAGDDAGFVDCLERFTREAKALTRLSQLGQAGDGVVKVMTFFETNGTAYIVMEYLAGLGLDGLIRASPAGIGSDSLNTIFNRLLQALSSVHDAGLLHRDIKPENILLRDDGRPVLIDFGATRAAGTGHTVYTQIYTPSYAPIEQFNGEMQGPYSDIYALGMTSYRAIGGTIIDPASHMPIDARRRDHALRSGQPDPLPPAVRIGAGRYPEPLLAAIDATLVVAPDRRPQSVAAVLARLKGDSRPTIVVPMAGPQRSIATPAPDRREEPTRLPPRSAPAKPRPDPDLRPDAMGPGPARAAAPIRRGVIVGTAILCLVALLIGGMALVAPRGRSGPGMPIDRPNPDRAAAEMKEAADAAAAAKAASDKKTADETAAAKAAAERMAAVDKKAADDAKVAKAQAAKEAVANARADLERQIAAQTKAFDTKMAAGDLEGAQAALATAKKLKQTLADLQTDLDAALAANPQDPRAYLDQQIAAQGKAFDQKVASGDLEGAQAALAAAKRLKQARAALQP
jgi:serine/threonine protein kinase